MKKKKQGISMIVTIIIVSIVIICIGLIVYFLFNKNSSKKDGNSSNSLETQESVGKTSDGVAKPEDYMTLTVENDKSVEIANSQNADIKVADIPTEINGEKVVGISDYAFDNYKNLEEVIVPGTVEKIGEFAFFLNSKLKKVTLNEGVKEIGKECFSQDTALVEVSLPSTLKTISVGAFLYCPNLERVTIPNGVERIEEAAFSRCEKLKEIHIPSSVTFIQNDSREKSSAFNYDENVTIYAPKGSYAEKYAKQENIKFVAE